MGIGIKIVSLTIAPNNFCTFVSLMMMMMLWLLHLSTSQEWLLLLQQQQQQLLLLRLVCMCSTRQEWLCGESYPVYVSVYVSVTTQHLSEWILWLSSRLSARRHFLLYVH